MVCWDIPMEAVRALAGAEGTAILTRLALRQAAFSAQARLYLNGGFFVGEFTFEEPMYPGRAQTAAVQLIAVPQENALVVAVERLAGEGFVG